MRLLYKPQTILGRFGAYVSLNVLGMIGLSVYILADTFFIANGVGIAGLAALNLALVVFSFLHSLGLMLGVGAATYFQINITQGRNKQARAAFSWALVLALGVIALIYVIGIVLAPQTADFLGARADTHELTVVYLRTICAFAPAFLLNDICLAFVRNDGSPHLAMAAMLCSSTMNIFLDWLFVIHFGWGMFGAAFATGLSPLISLIVLSVHAKGRCVGFLPLTSPVKLETYKAIPQRIVAFGFSSWVCEVSGGVVLYVFNLILLHFAGTTGVAAYGIIANLAFVATAIFVGIGQGVQPLASQVYARQDFASLIRIVVYSIVLCLGLSCVMQLVVLSSATHFAELFNPSQDKALTCLAAEGLQIYFWGYFFAGINIVMAALLSAVEHARQAWFVALLRGFVSTLLCAFVLVQSFGVLGAWLAFPVGEALASLLVGIFVMGLIKKHKALERKDA